MKKIPLIFTYKTIKKIKIILIVQGVTPKNMIIILVLLLSHNNTNLMIFMLQSNILFQIQQLIIHLFNIFLLHCAYRLDFFIHYGIY